MTAQPFYESPRKPDLNAISKRLDTGQCRASAGRSINGDVVAVGVGGGLGRACALLHRGVIQSLRPLFPWGLFVVTITRLAMGMIVEAARLKFTFRRAAAAFSLSAYWLLHNLFHLLADSARSAAGGNPQLSG